MWVKNKLTLILILKIYIFSLDNLYLRMENKFKLLTFIILCYVVVGCKKESYNISTFDAYKEEPPKNPFLSDSPWPITHYNCYAQASSPYA